MYVCLAAWAGSSDSPKLLNGFGLNFPHGPGTDVSRIKKNSSPARANMRTYSIVAAGGVDGEVERIAVEMLACDS